MDQQSDNTSNNTLVYKKALSPEPFICLGVILLLFGSIAYQLGFVTMLKSMFATANNLLIGTCFYIMAIAVLAGAFANVLTEFGVIALLNILLFPLMGPVFGLPGAASIGIITTFLSDNPAILTLCDDIRFRYYFKKYQLPALTNLGTAYGMGMIVIVFMLGLQGSFKTSLGLSIIVGLCGAIFGSIVSTRLMLIQTAKRYGKLANCVPEFDQTPDVDLVHFRQVRQGGLGRRLIDSLLEGGASGVKVGFAIIPGVLTICTLVILMTNQPTAAIPGVGWLPWLGEKLSFIFVPLFGFSSPQGVAVPITALGSAGAAIGLLPDLVKQGLISVKDIAVFTAMSMCWSGYLATHVAMMDSLKSRELTGAAIISHTIGGLAAGIFANWFFQLISLFV